MMLSVSTLTVLSVSVVTGSEIEGNMFVSMMNMKMPCAQATRSLCRLILVCLFLLNGWTALLAVLLLD